ncbi:RagB/SusD family nutrient uptake outer membrane protein [Chitinophaga agrisoli]|uniref:RagB/SusD family nutrient uptake outer membrane protein n=1 Tax=Chitinophaga agrisoli TaxID=2607653 RepID=A0A5B2VWN8_9BACT|nr:RagB/SusD family nutrient uptake outer membrane protein [Chitinophaga agrisoli]KAA2243060.1 RagB/SusD family nutrient uptake outer membrane protein [Chitinophaga agrisoli]
MKRLHLTKIGLLLCGMLFIGAGCTKYLEENDPSNLAPDSYFTLPEHAETAVNSVYANLRFMSAGAGIFSYNFQLPEALSGTSASETGQNSDLNNLLNLAYDADNVHVRQWWNSLYRGIANANLAIAKIPDIPNMDEGLRARYIGEAKFLRALHYFYAVRLWGDVPLTIKPIESYTDPELYPGRTPQEEVYNQIVQDLKDAEAAGLPWTDQTGRANLGAAKSLLASVYLTMAGFPLNKGAQYYQLAADKANEVITHGDYSLFPTYENLHTPALKNRTEHIFQIQYSASVSDARADFQQPMLPNFGGVSAFGTQIGSTVPTRAFYNSYETGDKRKQEQQFFYTAYYQDGNGALKQLNAPYIFKHFDRAANGTAGVAGTAQSGMNWPLIRYAEVLLIYAEAQNEAAAAPSAAAIAALKQIRDRAALTTPATFTKAAFREAVWRERWYELCYEGKAWFDMLRLRKAFNEATKGFDNFVGHKFSYGPTLQEKHLLLPLPTLEMNNNPSLRPQNPGFAG